MSKKDGKKDGKDRRLANLRPFKKGESGNPSGRPKTKDLSDALRRKLAEKMPDAADKTIADAVADSLVKKAIDGDVQAIREVWNRVEGMPLRTVDVDVEMSVVDWRSVASEYGISQKEILDEATKLLSDGIDSDENS